MSAKRSKHHPSTPKKPKDDTQDRSLVKVEPAPSNLPVKLDNSRTLSKTDPLKQYMREVLQYPLLDPEEEIELSRKMHNEGDLEAAKKLVTANLRLVVKIAFEYRSVYTNTMDLVQEGNIGLMKAVSKYDPEKGARLGYYASWWIRSYILKYIIDNFRLVKVGTTQAQKKLFYQLMREKERLQAQGLNPGPKLLAEKLDVKEKEVVEMEQRLSSSGSELSLDAPVDEENEGRQRFLALLEDSGESADVALEKAELLSKLKQRLPEFAKTLSDRELKILKQRVLAEEPKTLQAVADQYRLTRERVRQIEAKVLEKLKAFMKEELAID